MKESRYIVGIDLGTTNSVVAYIDTSNLVDEFVEPEATIFKIPQITEPGQVQELEFLPSFTYIPMEKELPSGSLDLPWQKQPSYVVGAYASKRGAEAPGRMINSSKSWLCHPHLDRTSPILPFKGAESIEKKSPLEVSSYYLDHIKKAWNHKIASDNPEYALENQNVFLTVPASFDAVARELTVKAAQMAGLNRVTLLEEPQAAFYAWINRQKKWRNEAKVGDIILVCDIGGGTTDFSLIEIAEEDGSLVLNRIAVGNHILLGGDNMDLTLAYGVSKRFAEKGVKLDPVQMLGLVQSCRIGKEKMLNDPTYAAHRVVILGRGRSVIGGSLETEIQLSDVESTILDGFFPRCPASDSPKSGKATGFKELGLHYESDSAITKHLSKFLRQHVNKLDGKDCAFIHPTRILFNGGVSKALAIRKRIVDVVNEWLTEDEGQTVSVVEGQNPDLAVAQGAAFYGVAKMGRGIRIRGGAARAYYVGIETSMPAVAGMTPPLKALCVVPFGMEEGADSAIDQEFGMVVGEHAEFRFLSSTTRKFDKVGDILDDWEEDELEELAPFETTFTHEKLQGGAVVPVKLHSFLTELGALELWCESIDGDDKWKLEFNIREQE
jgi:molecular chaperone DnaK (HSP70)